MKGDSSLPKVVQFIPRCKCKTRFETQGDSIIGIRHISIGCPMHDSSLTKNITTTLLPPNPLTEENHE